MIFSIGIAGLVRTLFYLDEKPIAKVRKTSRLRSGEVVEDAPGQLVWEQYSEAQLAARFQNQKAMQEHGRRNLGDLQSWIVIGIDANWDTDTDLQFNPNFPTANQIVRPCQIVELQSELMFDTKPL